LFQESIFGVASSIRRNSVRTFLAAVWLLTASPLFAQQSNHSRAFDYDQKAPLNIQEAGVDHRGDVAIHDISYASPKGGRVPAFLAVPEGKGPFPAVLWGHWYWPTSAFFNRKEFLEEAVALAHAGVISLLTTGPNARPGHADDQDELSDQQVTDLIQAIVDMRRAGDLLLARKDVDATRLAYVGHSYNATVGGFLSGIDKRFKFKLYDAPHALNAEARRDRIAFLAEQLKLSALAPAVIDAIPDLPQPPAPKP
jgi:hypothetical protein